MKFINTIGKEKKDPTLQDNPDKSTKISNDFIGKFYNVGPINRLTYRKIIICLIAFAATLFFWACIAHKSLAAVSMIKNIYQKIIRLFIVIF